ncbi:MAG: hypothetical protein HXY21_00250 [Parvularculaceae bacterium]|nr:hypothetical protein [Parvularculaceae bacterium]
MRARLSIVRALAALAAVFGCADASPWNRADGDVFVASRFDYFWSTTGVSRYERYGSDAYLEFGLTPNWMLSGKVYYGTAISDSGLGRFSRTRFGESELSLQRQLQRGAHSATAVSIAGAWSERLADGLRTPFVEPDVDLELRALHGRDLILDPLKVFLVGETAYRRRFGAAADQLRADALIGLEPSSRWLFMAEARSQISLGNEGRGGDDYSVVKGRASIVWRRWNRWSLIVGGEKEFAARAITPGTAVFIGAWSEF